MVVRVVKECEQAMKARGKTFETLDSVDSAILRKCLVTYSNCNWLPIIFYSKINTGVRISMFLV